MTAKWAYAMVLSALCSFGAVYAGELGNVYGSPEIEQASRESSAAALAALRDLFEAARLREIGEGSGSELFLAAAENLRVASNGFSALVEAEVGFELTEDERSYVIARIGDNFFGDIGMANVSHLSVLLSMMGEATFELSNLLLEISGDFEGLILPNLSPRVERILALGEVISTIGEGRLD
ncbi:hypothetical protein [Roseicyclus marinus]|uniref:hypothetical protein n=1 Tax=Roseicyclus marinus TaxID=2161673 RepID=UPI00240FB7F3|nr:hypothetical protein [Roseicyclus marinus]MDG3041617.1 hypothetical protein [Roseicyclus marinus]